MDQLKNMLHSAGGSGSGQSQNPNNGPKEDYLDKGKRLWIHEAVISFLLFQNFRDVANAY